MKAAELRKSILQAAVQGKLVPQDMHDEPASVLLERICAEKARLVKEGKIKKENPLPPITEDEIPYDLPEGWVWCRLSDVGEIVGGSTPDTSNASYYTDPGSGIPWITPADMKKAIENIIYRGKKDITVDGYNSCSTRIIPKGSIVFSSRAPIGLIAFAGNDLCTNQGFKSVIPYIMDLKNWIYYSLQNKTEDIINRAPGTTFKEVSGTFMQKEIIPLPPLAEQQRIVAKVNELMTLCDELEATEQELEALENRFEEYLPKSILQAAVQGKLVPQDLHDEPASVLLERIRAEKARLVKEGKIKKEKPLPPISEDEIPYDLPEGWVWCRLGELCNFGVTISTIPDNIPDDAWVLELEDIQKDTGEIVQYKTKAERKSKSSKHVFYKGDVLYSKLRPYLNKVTIAEKDGYCSSEILPLQFCKDIYPQYAICFLRSPTFVDYAIERSYGVKMPRLGTEDGRNALFPLPPLAEQQRIVAKVDELMALCEEIKAVKTKPIGQMDTKKVIDFPAIKQDEQLQLAARGIISKNSSNELMQAIDDMFAGDE
jgi:type I restriction enzyme S subunit